MEFLDLFFPVLISIFTFVLQLRKDEVMDSTPQRRVKPTKGVIKYFCGSSPHLQRACGVPKSPQQANICILRQDNPGVSFNSRSCCPSAGGTCFLFFLFLPQQEAYGLCLPAAAVAPTGAWQLQAAEKDDGQSSRLPVADLISSFSGATASAIVSQAVPGSLSQAISSPQTVPGPLGLAAPYPSAVPVPDPVDQAATTSQEMFVSSLSIEKN
jgi:hypothetical protein